VGETAVNSLHTFLLLATAFLIVFLESSFNGFRLIAGAQVDLLPSLMVYTAFSSSLTMITSLAICGGLWHDSLSANPLGISILPLFVIGLALHSNRGLILKDEPFARFMLGMGASAAAPLMTLLLLLNTDHKPMIGWFTLWQWVVMSLIGAVVTPWWFRFFYWLNTTLSYKPLAGTSFRPDRQIKRGR